MTSSGKVRIYELSRDLGLDNKDVLDAAEKLGVAAKSHSSSISDDEAVQIRRLLARGANGSTAAPVSGTQAPAKAPAPARFWRWRRRGPRWWPARTARCGWPTRCR